MGTSRFATMRTFREEITEFAIDANQEAVDFQKHLWRYPLRIELAIEYLGLSPAEYQTLYVNPISATDLRDMYGFPADTIDGVDWKSIVVHVPEFLKRTGLDYCEFLELWRSKFVEFERQSSQRRARPDPTGAAPNTGFPDCEPCCPEDLVISFINPAAAEDALRRLMVFIRLWRSLKCLPGAGYSFADLRDICLVLGLFQGATSTRSSSVSSPRSRSCATTGALRSAPTLHAAHECDRRRHARGCSVCGPPRRPRRSTGRWNICSGASRIAPNASMHRVGVRAATAAIARPSSSRFCATTWTRCRC